MADRGRRIWFWIAMGIILIAFVAIDRLYTLGY
jgi:hypothetical protein